MKPGLRVEFTAGTIASMTPEQFSAIQKVVSEGSWDHLDESDLEGGRLRISGGDYLGVHLPNFFLGIERDGYTHS